MHFVYHFVYHLTSKQRLQQCKVIEIIIFLQIFFIFFFSFNLCFMICDFLIFFWQIISHVLKKKIQDHISIIMCLGGFKALLYRKMCDLKYDRNSLKFFWQCLCDINLSNFTLWCINYVSYSFCDSTPLLFFSLPELWINNSKFLTFNLMMIFNLLIEIFKMVKKIVVSF